MKVTAFEHPLALGRLVVVRLRGGEVQYGEVVQRTPWQSGKAEGWDYNVAVPTADEARTYLVVPERRVQPLDLRNPEHLALVMEEQST